MYSVEYSKKAFKELEKLDRSTANLIYTWIEKNLVGCSNPRTQGKALVGDKKGYWRYRVGTYRVITKIDDEKITIFVVHIGHRKDIYK